MVVGYRSMVSLRFGCSILWDVLSRTMNGCENVARTVGNRELPILMIGWCHDVSQTLEGFIYVMESAILVIRSGGKPKCSCWLGGSMVGSSVVKG